MNVLQQKRSHPMNVRRRAARCVLVALAPLTLDGCLSIGVDQYAAKTPAADARFYAKRLNEQAIVVTAREGFLRFSPHVGNDEEEAARILAALRAAP